MKVFVILCCIAITSGRKIIVGTPGDPFVEFANDRDVLIPEDDPNKAPSDFRGDVMKARIFSSENTNHGKGRFRYAVETENGIAISQGGKLRSDGKTFVVHGSYSFTGADGKRYRTRYTADERGFHPVTELEEIEVPDYEPIVPVGPLIGTGLRQRNSGYSNNSALLNDVVQQTYFPPTTLPPPITRLYLPAVPSPPPRLYLPPSGYLPPPQNYGYY